MTGRLTVSVRAVTGLLRGPSPAVLYPRICTVYSVYMSRYRGEWERAVPRALSSCSGSAESLGRRKNICRVRTPGHSGVKEMESDFPAGKLLSDIFGKKQKRYRKIKRIWSLFFIRNSQSNMTWDHQKKSRVQKKIC